MLPDHVAWPNISCIIDCLRLGSVRFGKAIAVWWKKHQPGLAQEGLRRRLHGIDAARDERMDMIERLVDYSQRHHPDMEVAGVLKCLDERY